jgi:hypothetical protein
VPAANKEVSMLPTQLADFEKRLLATADALWANTGLGPAQFSDPVLEVIFPRDAERRFREFESALLRKSMDACDIEPFDHKAEGNLYAHIYDNHFGTGTSVFCP